VAGRTTTTRLAVDDTTPGPGLVADARKTQGKVWTAMLAADDSFIPATLFLSGARK